MGPMGSPLTKNDIGFPQGSIGGEFRGAAIDKRATSHHYLALIARHLGRNGIQVGTDGRIGLNGFTEGDQLIGRTEFNRLNNIASRHKGAGLTG